MKPNKITPEEFTKLLVANSTFDMAKLKAVKATMDKLAGDRADYLVEWNGEWLEYRGVPPRTIPHPPGAFIMSAPTARYFNDWVSREALKDPTFLDSVIGKWDHKTDFGVITIQGSKVFDCPDRELEEIVMKLAPWLYCKTPKKR